MMDLDAQAMSMEILSADRVTDAKHLNLFRIAYRDRFRNRKDWVLASRRQVPTASRYGRR